MIAEHLGDAYFKGQLVEKARVMYEKALEQAENTNRARDIKQKISAIDVQYKGRPENRQPASVAEDKLPLKPSLEK